MPSISFVLPHWLFWASLAFFPAIAWYFVNRTIDAVEAGRPNRFLAYLFWFFGGFLGLHRIYLNSRLALLYLPLFAVILYGGTLYREAREDFSKMKSDADSFTRLIERAKPAADRGSADAKRRIEAAEQRLKPALERLKATEAGIDRANLVMRTAGGITLLLLLIDAALIPGLVRRRREEEPLPAAELETPPIFVDDAKPPLPGLSGRIVEAIDRVVRVIGEYSGYWAILAVFAYYFEVIGRYVFNSPTNWVHESTFLLFGMQYMLVGAYAYRGESHVRVDLLYTHLSDRGKAVCDIIGAVFVSVFVLVMLATGWTFAIQAIQAQEVSFTEWGIQYWPVKLAIPIGAALLMLQVIARLIRDIHIALGAPSAAQAS